MLKHLYLFRHAEAVGQALNQPDKERELTPAGRDQSLQMGTYLLRENTSVDCMICSSATRAKQTAHLAAAQMKFEIAKIIVDDFLYDVASTTPFIDYIGKLKNTHNTIVIVGHNPVLSYLTEYLTSSAIENLTPAGIAILKFNIPSWKEVSKGNGELVKYIYPGLIDKNQTA